MLKNNWDATLYEGKHTFVWKYGEELLKILSPQPGERILDIGCGTGQLTAQIADAEATVMGIDADAAMIEKAKANYPHLEFVVADARSFQVDTQLDAVFSNAALHWIPEADAVIQHIHQALKPQGRFVAEFGGKGNVKAITNALHVALDEIGTSIQNPWYFPSISDYTTRLENHGFEVVYAVLFKRPTPLTEGDAGLKNWLGMFASRFLPESTEQQNHVLDRVEQLLKPVLYRDGIWTADYQRIRVVGIKGVGNGE
jgi:trans-aconitate methyltransferase